MIRKTNNGPWHKILGADALKIWNNRFSSSSPFLQPSLFPPCLMHPPDLQLFQLLRALFRLSGLHVQSLVHSESTSCSTPEFIRKTVTALDGNLMQVQLHSNVVGIGSLILELLLTIFLDQMKYTRVKKSNYWYSFQGHYPVFTVQ